MASNAEPDALVDSSAAVAALVDDHPHGREVRAQLGNRTLGLAGHAAFETFSVLTRLPPEVRLAPAAVAEQFARHFPSSRYLTAKRAAALVPQLVAVGISGGAVFDALVAAAAVEHDLPLVTRDRRAAETYRAMGANVEFVGGSSNS